MSNHESVNAGKYRVELGLTSSGWYFQVYLLSTQFDERNGDQITPDRLLTTEGGFENRQIALGCGVAWADEYDDEQENNGWDGEPDERGHCICSLCYCNNRTEYGGICNECLAGSHQG